MKKLVLTYIAGLAACAPLLADTIRVWDFNSVAFDSITTTGSRRPQGGVATPAESIGGVGNRFGVVSTADQPADPNSLDNSHWRLGQTENPTTGVTDVETGFPVATNGNKTAGAVFPVNTSGFTNIHVTWNQENSASASRYWRVQYTTNGTTWLDTTNVITAVSLDPNGLQTGTPVWQKDLSADFSALPGVNNNPNFAFRLVSEFEATATGSGTNAYVANRVGTSYGRAGTLWLEMVTVMGDSINSATQWPTVSAIPDQNILTNESSAVIGFTVGDAETAATSLIVSATTSDSNIISGISLGGTDANRTIQVTPVSGAQGLATVTVRVQDQDGKVSDAGFEVAVTVPTIFPVAGAATTWDVPVFFPLITTNMPGDPATEWHFTGGSSVTSVVANAGIEFGTSATSSNYVKITPVNQAAGETTITVTNTGPRGWQAIQSFTLKVLPSTIVFYSLTGLPTANPPATWANSFATNGLSAGPLSRGPGIVAAGLTNGFSANNWNNTNSASHPVLPSRTNAIAEGEYFQFQITVSNGFKASLASIETSLRRSAIDAPMNYELQYSFDGFATPGITLTNFNYFGRTSGTAPGNIAPYRWMTTDTAGQDPTPGNPTWPFIIDSVAALQNIPGGTTITFRIYAWGTGAGADSNTVALGRGNGPMIRGTVVAAPSGPSLSIISSGSNIQISWPTNSGPSTLQSRSDLVSGSWNNVATPPTVSGTNYTVTVSNSGGPQFYRLAQ